MLTTLNRYPGISKLTIGREVVAMIGGRLLDNQSRYNVAFALTEFKLRAFIWTEECLLGIRELARVHEPLFVVLVICDVDENKRRIQSEG